MRKYFLPLILQMTTRKYGGPDGEFMSGIKIRSGSRVDGISGFYCKKPTEIDDNTQALCWPLL
jgi:hypothetical protein